MATDPREELAEIGRRRAAALAEADAQLEQVKDRYAVYRDASISIAEIGRLAHVSRPTLHQLERERFAS